MLYNYLQTNFQYASSFVFECEYHNVDSEYFKFNEDDLYRTYFQRKAQFINRYIKKISLIYLSGHEGCMEQQSGIEGILNAIKYKQYYLQTKKYDGFKLVCLGSPLLIYLEGEENIKKMRTEVEMSDSGILAWWDDSAIGFVIHDRIESRLVEAIQKFMENLVEVKETYPNGIILKCE